MISMFFFLFVCLFVCFSYKLALPLSSFTLIKKIFSSSLLSAIKMVLSTYLRLLMLLLLILIAVCNSASLGFCMMCSTYRLNKQGFHTPFILLSYLNQTGLSYSFFNLEPTNCSIQGSNCCFFTRIQISQEKGKMAWYYHLFKSFPQFIMK